MSPARTRDILNFESGLTYELSLKYPTGKQVSNGRIMFSTVNDAVFFLDADDAEKIYGLNLKPQEKFRLMKQGNSRNSVIEVSRIQQEQQVVRPAAAPGPVDIAPDLPSSTTTQSTSLSRIMASSYISAIDALIIARDYAESKGIPFRLSPQEVRAAAHCIYISASRMGGR